MTGQLVKSPMIRVITQPTTAVIVTRPRDRSGASATGALYECTVANAWTAVKHVVSQPARRAHSTVSGFEGGDSQPFPERGRRLPTPDGDGTTVQTPMKGALMTARREFRNRAYSLSPQFEYLADRDRYLLAADPPRLRFNLIGAGSNGQEHIRVAALEGRATIHGVYDPNPGSVAAAQRVAGRSTPSVELVVYDSVAAACHDPGIDGLIIATPNHTHIDVVREAVTSGKPILLEKPMATTLADAFEIMERARGYASVFQVGLQYRYKPIYVEAIHEALVRRSVGEIKSMSIFEHRIPFLDKVNQWNKFRGSSGGTLVEKCCHYFDLFNLFSGSRPVSVFASGSMAVNFREFEYEGKKSDILDNATVLVRYESDVRATFTLCMFAPLFHEELILCGDGGRLRASERQDFLAGSRPTAEVEVLCSGERTSRVMTPSYPRFIEESGHNGGTFIEQMTFVDAIEGAATDAATAEDGFWSVVIGVAAEESVRTGLPVAIRELLAREAIDVALGVR